jgi:hypothetical protein
MYFGLKNVGATYQRAIQQCLRDEIRDYLVEAYVDDVGVKTRDASTLIDNLDRNFKVQNRYKWKLNPKKCIFGVPSGILLGNVVGHDGIRPNPSKVRAVLDMRPNRNVKDVQKLTGCMVALSRFISILGEKGSPSSNYLKHPKNRMDRGSRCRIHTAQSFSHFTSCLHYTLT